MGPWCPGSLHTDYTARPLAHGTVDQEDTICILNLVATTTSLYMKHSPFLNYSCLIQPQSKNKITKPGSLSTCSSWLPKTRLNNNVRGLYCWSLIRCLSCSSATWRTWCNSSCRRRRLCFYKVHIDKICKVPCLVLRWNCIFTSIAFVKLEIFL